MGPGTPQVEDAPTGDLTTDGGSHQESCRNAKTQGGKTVAYGIIVAKSVRHFWPSFSAWLNELPDTRKQELVVYDRRFLMWWGILLFQLRLGSRRQLDYHLRDLETHVLDNLNRLADTAQDSLPVHKTLDHFLGHVGSAALAHLLTLSIRRLIRMKALDHIRRDSSFVVALDGSGYLSFSRPHCPVCLTRKQGDVVLYFHHVLEAKIVGMSGLALSIGSEFIDNTDRSGANQIWDETVKQDCELKAFTRLARQLKRQYPQTPLCISGDSIYACGTGFQTCKDQGWDFVFVFKEGRTPALWADFIGLLGLEPGNLVRCKLPNGTKQRFRWVNQMRYEDTEGRTHILDAIICEETADDGTATTYAWVTNLKVTRHNVIEIAEKGGRVRSKIENQGFNIQKNNGYNMEHAYSEGPDSLKCFYILLQIAHMILQLVERGSLLKKLAHDYGTTIPKLLGSINNLSRRLLECLRYFRIPDSAFDPQLAAACQIRLDTG